MVGEHQRNLAGVDDASGKLHLGCIHVATGSWKLDQYITINVIHVAIPQKTTKKYETFDNRSILHFSPQQKSQDMES